MRSHKLFYTLLKGTDPTAIVSGIHDDSDNRIIDRQYLYISKNSHAFGIDIREKAFKCPYCLGDLFSRKELHLLDSCVRLGGTLGLRQCFEYLGVREVDL